MLFMEYKDVKVKSEEYKKAEYKLLAMEQKYISDEFGIITNGLTYLSKTLEKSYANQRSKNNLSENWILFIDNMTIYHQASFMNIDGDIVFAIQHDFSGSYEVENTNLSDQEKNAYKNASKLKNGQIYISPLSLKKINNSYVTPLVPIITIATPVFYNNQCFGVVILHYDANYTFNRFEDISIWGEGQLSLLTNEGYWIYDTYNTNFEGQFEYRTISYNDIYPNAWRNILNGNTQFLNAEGLFTVNDLHLDNYLDSIMRDELEYDKYIVDNVNWMIVSRIDPDSKIGYYTSPTFYKVLQNIIKNKLVYIILLFFISIIVTLLMDYNRRAKLRIKYYATHDGMTDLWNRKTGLEILESKLPSQNKRKSIFAICYIDINGLKEVNDILGHQFGDKLILDVAVCLNKTIRKTDLAIRMGGDEFMLILNDVDKKEANIVWQHIETSITQMNEVHTKPYLISISHGIICSSELKNYSSEELIVEADKRMYENKLLLKKGLQVIRN